MTAPRIVKGGRVVSGDGIRRQDLLLRDGRVAAVGEPGAFDDLSPDSTEIDAAGCHVLPGLVDVHVHGRDPGQTEKEDFAHMTEAAAAGGVTTVVDMPNTIPPVADADTVTGKRKLLAEQAHVDFGLWGMILGGQSQAELDGLIESGVLGLKLFWGYALDVATKTLAYDEDAAEDTIPPPDDGEILRAFRQAAAAGVPVGVHAENRALNRRAKEAARRADMPDEYKRFLAGRPAVAEEAQIRQALTLAAEAGCRLHVLHVTTAAGAGMVGAARRRGETVSGETCPHYLTLEASDYRDIGAVMKCFPPIRSGERDGLWRELRADGLQTLGSDHAPHSPQAKRQTLAAAPAGFPGVETMLPVMLEHCRRGRLTLPELVRLGAEAPAEIFGLAPTKGHLLPGADADFVLVDLENETRIRAATLHSKSRITPYEGRAAVGPPAAVYLRGHKVAEAGRAAGDHLGQFLPRPA